MISSQSIKDQSGDQSVKEEDIRRYQVHYECTSNKKILAVGNETQIGAYFFLASGVPRFGSSSAIATLAREHAAAAAAANTRSLLFVLLSWSGRSLDSENLMALAITTPRRALVDGCFNTVVAAELLRNEAVMVMEAISGSLSPPPLFLPYDGLLSLTCNVWTEENCNV
ncbi:hypothetical protein Cgig2_002260 [Carnegiea gigantea]|uniref:Uncharacterized protein n=1 Tax=Carnegiea gigantea TaxID=171969 RepID=A0A9Q1KV58_9CARY|nr:hypothetical protein Cgig2_002260 [Carnegiea gigantea]